MSGQDPDRTSESGPGHVSPLPSRRTVTSPLGGPESNVSPRNYGSFPTAGLVV